MAYYHGEACKNQISAPIFIKNKSRRFILTLAVPRHVRPSTHAPGLGLMTHHTKEKDWRLMPYKKAAGRRL